MIQLWPFSDGLLARNAGQSILVTDDFLAKPKRTNRDGFLIIVLVVILVGYAGFSFYPSISGIFEESSLRDEGVLAPAEILHVNQTRHRINEDWVYELILDVRPKGKEPYQATVSQRFDTLHLANLRKGAHVTVKYDRANPKKVVVMSTGTAPAPNPAGSACARRKRGSSPVTGGRRRLQGDNALLLDRARHGIRENLYGVLVRRHGSERLRCGALKLPGNGEKEGSQLRLVFRA